MLLAPSLLLGGASHPSVSSALGAAAWVTGEYASHVRDPTSMLEALLQPNVALLPPDVQAVYMQVRQGGAARVQCMDCGLCRLLTGV